MITLDEINTLLRDVYMDRITEAVNWEIVANNMGLPVSWFKVDPDMEMDEGL